MKLLYLSPDMSFYGGAQYQHDVMQELARQAEVAFYGPGFPTYNAADTVADAIAKSGFRPDFIIAGHAWLQDKPGAPVERFAHIDLSRTDIPKAALLNKEYTNLQAKLDYFRRIGASVVFSHHHDAPAFQRRAGIPCIFWPFAADHRLFHDKGGPEAKTIDLGFSGILQNPTPGNQSDLRARIMQRLFECDGDVPVAPRDWCRHLRLRFNALPRDAASAALAQKLGVYKRMDTPRYAAFVRSCRAFLCTRSPADLVSPRYFECMLSRTLVIAERNAAHKALFPPGCLIEFSDEADFQDKLLAALQPGAMDAMLHRARLQAAAKHTWDRRIAALLVELKKAHRGAAAVAEPKVSPAKVGSTRAA